MVTSQIELFRNELKEWDKSLQFFDDEMLILEHRLQEVVMKNTNTTLLAQVEHFQNQFILQKEQFDILQHDINERKSSIESTIREKAALMNGNGHEKQNEFRSKVQTTEKIFRDTREEFYRFLSKIQ